MPAKERLERDMAIAIWQVALREAALKLKRMVDAASTSARRSKAVAQRDAKSRRRQTDVLYSAVLLCDGQSEERRTVVALKQQQVVERREGTASNQFVRSRPARLTCCSKERSWRSCSDKAWMM